MTFYSLILLGDDYPTDEQFQGYDVLNRHIKGMSIPDYTTVYGFSAHSSNGNKATNIGILSGLLRKEENQGNSFVSTTDFAQVKRYGWDQKPFLKTQSIGYRFVPIFNKTWTPVK